MSTNQGIFPLKPFGKSGLTQKYVDRLLKQHDLNEVPLVREVVQRSVRLPDIHNDPFDRVLIALCQKERWLLLSKDKVIRKYPGIQVVW
jgi:PIN domain nuclease of toxin-antitoxin system